MDARTVQIQRVHRLRKKKEGKRAKTYSRQILEIQGLRTNSFPGKTSKRQQLQDVSGFTIQNRPEKETTNADLEESHRK